MKQVIIFHGTGEDPGSFWIPYTKSELEKTGYKVIVPALPNTNNPVLSEQLEEALKQNHTQETILIGHSSGCPLILSVLEHIQVKVKKAIFVAGYSSPLSSAPDATYNIQVTYNWETIKQHCSEFIFINAVNDPWGADDKQGRAMFEKLGCMLIINNEGHMGSDSFNQPYKEFPLLVSLVKL